MSQFFLTHCHTCAHQLQGELDSFDDIVTGVGSGGTVAGLAIANYLTGSKLKCVAMGTCTIIIQNLRMIQCMPILFIQIT